MTTPTNVNIWQGISAIGSAVSGFAQISQGRRQQEIYEENAEIARQKATYEEDKSRAKFKKLRGIQRSLYGKAGVDLTSGSPLLIMSESAAEGELEAEMIRWGGETEAQQLKRYGKEARRAGMIAGTSTFLTGLSKAGLSYEKEKKGLSYWDVG